MERLVSSDFYNILSQVSDQDLNGEHIFDVFRRELPKIADYYGFVLMRACLYEPIKRSRDMNVQEIELYNVTGGKECNILELEYPTSNGGRVVITSGISNDDFWSEELKEDNYVLSRLIFLLVGRAKTMNALLDLTFFDQMTGIANETGLNRFMGKTMAQGRFAQYASNFLNIKNMKLLNSRYGEDAGNAVMVGFANAINEFAEKQCNGIAARLGGDNFLAFVEASKEEEFIQFVNQIAIPYKTGSGRMIDIHVEARIGYYYIKAGDGINEAMRNSDVAIKQARKNSMDIVKFEETMKTQMLRIKQLEQNVPNAIANKEFVVFYQPKVDISDENHYVLNGAEALVRWMKDGEMISPAEFVPVLERSGLISLIDYYVLEQICEDINDWIARGLKPVKVSSNFSRRHLQDSEFAERVMAIINKHHVDPKYIEIEITESYDNEDMQALMRFEQKMHAFGVELAVDDFGSGFSSLKMIKNIVADTIKLDKSIIDGIGSNGPDDIIISHIIKMIECLGKNVIAEGVETKEQAQFLRENGCSNIQGFLFSRPVAKDGFEKFMK